MTLSSSFNYNGIPGSSQFTPKTYLTRLNASQNPLPLNNPGYSGYWSSIRTYFINQIVLYIAETPPVGFNRFTFYQSINDNFSSITSPNNDGTNWICIFDTGVVDINTNNGSSLTSVYGADPTIIISYFTRPQLLQFIYDTLINIPKNFINNGSGANTYVVSLGNLSSRASVFNTLITNQTSFGYTMTTSGRPSSYTIYSYIVNILWIVEETIGVQSQRIPGSQYNPKYCRYNESLTQSDNNWPSLQPLSTPAGLYYY
jgi:hypothetical protein